MSAADEQQKAREAYARGREQRAGAKVADVVARDSGAASAQRGGRP